MGVVLFAIDGLDESTSVALARAQALSQANGAALHAVRVIAPSSPQASTLVELFTGERDLRRLCRGVLPEALGSDRLQMTCGDFTREVSTLSRSGADIVVLADSATSGRRAATIARQACTPVLVARAHRHRGPVLGTTALEHHQYPEIRRACQFATWLEAPLMVFHSLPARRGEGQERDELLAMANCCELLKVAIDDLAPDAEVVVARNENPLDGVIEMEKRYRCDVLVVGASVSRSDDAAACFAESVVRRASGSVLVTPLQ